MQEANSNEDELRWIKGLEAYQILDTEDERPFNAITELAAELCQMPMAMVTLLDAQRQWFKAKVGISLRETSREFSFCHYTIQSHHILEVNDTLLDERFASNPFVTGEPMIRFYAGAPLVSEDGYTIGALCVMDTRPGKLSDLQRKSLSLLAQEIMLHIESAKKNRELKHHLSAAQEYQEMFNHSGDLHCILTEEGRIEFVNNSVVDILGYTADEVKGRSVWEFCPLNERDRVLSEIGQVRQKGVGQLKLEINVLMKSGATKIFSWNSVIRGGRWLVNGRDVTQQKKNQKLMEQLSLVASRVNNGVIINDANDNVLWVNNAFENITGYSAAEVVGKRAGDLLLRNYQKNETLLYARAQTADRKSFSVVVPAHRKDSTPIWLSVMNTIVLDSEGKTERSIEILTDITQFQEAESHNETLSLALSKSNVGIVVRDRSNRVVWFNDAFEAISGYSLDEFRGKHLGDILIGPDTSMDDYRKAKVAFANGDAYELENLFYTKAGGQVWLYLSNTPLFDPAGELDRQVGIVVDISERKKAEQEIIATREEAIRLAKAKEAFLSVMSHEMRTPLNAIIGISRILLDEDPLERQLENLDMLRFSTENLLTLINDVLDYTKIETGNLKLERRPVNLKKVVTSTVDSLQFKIDRSRVSMKVELDEAIPEIVVADKTRVYQILMNLIGNAIKFTDQGEISVSLVLVSEDITSVTIRFEVSDTGIGISPEKLEYIFESYTQENSDTTRKYGGTGLGLAITKRLIQLHGSDIHVKSEKGKGSSFYFTVRFERSEDLSGDEELTQIKPAALSSHILIVDDNPINRMVAQKAVMRWGIKSDTAEDGKKAFEMVKQKDYDLILMDLHMPGMDGYEATRLIRALPEEKYRTLPIIALTGSVPDKHKESIAEAGINDTVLKPFVPKELYRKIRSYLERKI